jgi:hypothetical protein
MTTKFRTVLHARCCLVGGQHAPGSEWARECPLNPERVQARHERAVRREANNRMALATTTPQNAA